MPKSTAANSAAATPRQALVCPNPFIAQASGGDETESHSARAADQSPAPRPPATPFPLPTRRSALASVESPGSAPAALPGRDANESPAPRPLAAPPAPPQPANALVPHNACLLYTSDAADEEDSVDLGGR